MAKTEENSASSASDVQLDRQDRSLLNLLQEDGRMTTRELAERINLSHTATTERVKRLTRNGFIEGYTAQLSPKKLSRSLLVFVEVKLDRTTADIFDDFSAAIKDSVDVMECHMVAGGFDYLIKARVADMEAYRKFLAETILALPGVRETHTFPVMEEVKNSTALPI